MDPGSATLRRYHEDRSRSRNRHFDELSHPEARLARRRLRRLDGIRRDLRAGGDVAVVVDDGPGGGYRIDIRFTAVRAERVAYVTVEEYELLVENADVAAILAAGLA